MPGVLHNITNRELHNFATNVIHREAGDRNRAGPSGSRRDRLRKYGYGKHQRARRSHNALQVNAVEWGSKGELSRIRGKSFNDEVERRGVSPASNEGTLSKSSTPPWLTEDATRERSNRLLGKRCPTISSRAILQLQLLRQP